MTQDIQRVVKRMRYTRPYDAAAKHAKLHPREIQMLNACNYQVTREDILLAFALGYHCSEIDRDVCMVLQYGYSERVEVLTTKSDWDAMTGCRSWYRFHLDVDELQRLLPLLPVAATTDGPCVQPVRWDSRAKVWRTRVWQRGISTPRGVFDVNKRACLVTAITLAMLGYVP